MVATVRTGSGRFTYEFVEGWEKLPPGYSWTDAAAVAVDSQDNVYVFNRGDHPMIVFDRDGNFLRSWGEGVFSRAHGLTLAPDGTLFCTDDGDHTVRQCTTDGRVLMTIGDAGKAVDVTSAATRSTAARTWRWTRQRATCTSQTATGTPASTSTRPTAGCCSRGDGPAPIRVSST